MPETRLQLTIPEDVWIGDLTRRYPDATFRILAAMSREETGVGLAEIRHDSLPELLEDMSAYDDVSEVKVLNEPDERGLVQFETTLPLLLLPARDSGVPLEMPFELADGTATWELTAPSERISELGDQLRQFDISFQIDYLQQRVTKEDLLTEAQESIVKQAIEMGYYDTPRACTLTDLADEVGRAKSTVSETLHRAEEKIIKEFFDDPAFDR